METKLEKQFQAQKYMDMYGIETLMSEMLNSLLHEKSEHPKIFMIKYLASQLTDEEKNEFGLVIPEPYPNIHPVVKYPKFSKDDKGILKHHMTKGLFNSLRKTKTIFGNNINSLSGLSKFAPEDKIGCLLTDSDCLNVYEEFLNKIIAFNKRYGFITY